jgi:hypothetical protein
VPDSIDPIDPIDYGPAQVLHTVPQAVRFARRVLADPTVTDQRFRNWMTAGKVRYRRFGGTFTFVIAELLEDLAGKTVNEIHPEPAAPG